MHHPCARVTNPLGARGSGSGKRLRKEAFRGNRDDWVSLALLEIGM